MPIWHFFLCLLPAAAASSPVVVSHATTPGSSVVATPPPLLVAVRVAPSSSTPPFDIILIRVGFIGRFFLVVLLALLYVVVEDVPEVVPAGLGDQDGVAKVALNLSHGNVSDEDRRAIG